MGDSPYPPYPPFPAFPPFPPYPAYAPSYPYGMPAPSGAATSPWPGESYAGWETAIHPAPASLPGSVLPTGQQVPPGQATVVPPPVHRSHYEISSISLAADPLGMHKGTGDQQAFIWAVDPTSVPGSGLLRFGPAGARTTTMLFELAAPVVPNWFGVSVPHGASDFTRPNIYFHPTPAQAGYKDSDYPTKSGKWPQLFYYMEKLGYQLDAINNSQIIVMPFLTSAATNTGILLADWFGIVSDILTDVRTAMGRHDGTILQISEVTVSSFSVGIVYSHAFRHHAAGLQPFLRKVWDFDGALSSSASLSQALASTSDYQVTKYDQHTMPNSFHVPRPRWAKYPLPVNTTLEVHHLIRDSMLLHAATV